MLVTCSSVQVCSVKFENCGSFPENSRTKRCHAKDCILLSLPNVPPNMKLLVLPGFLNLGMYR